MKTYLMQYQYGSWVTLKSWSLSKNTPFASIVESYYVSKGYKYKVIVNVFVYDEDNNLIDFTSENTTVTSY